MKRLKLADLLLIAVLCVCFSSCGPVYIPVGVSSYEYHAGVVPVSSVGMKDANYQVLKKLTATCEVKKNGVLKYAEVFSGRTYNVVIDGENTYEYTYSDALGNSVLTRFNRPFLELGIIDGFPKVKDIRNPELDILAQQVAAGKIIKELLSLNGDAITTPVIEICQDKPSIFETGVYTVKMSAYAIKLNTKK